MKNLLSLLFISCFCAAFSQFSFEGVVIDENNEPIPFSKVSIYNESNTLQTRTDVNGRFLIQKVPFNTYFLTVSYIGYTSKEIFDFEIKKNVSYTFSLFPSVQRSLEDESSIDNVPIL